MTKTWISWEQKAFFITSKGSSIKQITQIFFWKVRVLLWTEKKSSVPERYKWKLLEKKIGRIWFLLFIRGSAKEYKHSLKTFIWMTASKLDNWTDGLMCKELVVCNNLILCLCSKTLKNTSKHIRFIIKLQTCSLQLYLKLNSLTSASQVSVLQKNNSLFLQHLLVCFFPIFCSNIKWKFYVCSI